MPGIETPQNYPEDLGLDDEEENVPPAADVDIDLSTLTPLSPEIISKQVWSTQPFRSVYTHAFIKATINLGNLKPNRN
jgi:hypothetical protein